MKKKIKTFCPIFSGFYNTIWEPDFDYEAEYLEEQGFIGDCTDNFNNKAYEQMIGEAFCDRMEQELGDFVYSIEYEDIYSPKYYNYSTDSINCIIAPKFRSIKKYIYANKAAYEKFLEDNYKSRSGFSSFYNHDFESWKEYTKNFSDYSEKPLYLGSVLEFICQNEKLENHDIYDSISGNYGISEFMDDKIYSLIYRAETFVRENYTKDNLFDLMLIEFEDDADDIDFDVIIKRITEEIESNTMKMTF